MGWSWGAMLALSCASARAQAQDPAPGVVLVGCGTYDLASRAEYVRRMEERLGEAGRARKAALKEALAQVETQAERDALLGQLGALSDQAQSVDLLPAEPEGPEVEFDAQGHRETWEDVLRLQREGVEPDSFSAIASPVLMLHGAEDPHPGDLTRDTLRGPLPQLEYRELPRCGHEPWRERAAREAFFSELVPWLQGTLE